MDPVALAAARRYARWHLGDYVWADQILNAYNNPVETNSILDDEMGDEG